MQTIWKRGNVLNKGEGAFVSSAHFVQLSMMYNQHSHSFISILTLLFVFFVFTTWNELVSEIDAVDTKGGIFQIEDNRPPINQRNFTSPVIEAVINETAFRMKSKKLATMFVNCFPNTLDTTVNFTYVNGKPDTFVVTGDIPAMWLRDSSAQIDPYIPFITRDLRLKDLVRGVINRQARYINVDVYANAFNRVNGPSPNSHDIRYPPMNHSELLFEGKYELDSLAWVMRLSTRYYEHTRDSTLCKDPEWKKAIWTMINAIKYQQSDTSSMNQRDLWYYSFSRWTTQQTETLEDGIGIPGKRCGMSRSPFRPSDDAHRNPYPIAANAMTVVGLRKISDIFSKDTQCRDEKLSSTAKQLAEEIDQGIRTWGVVNHPKFGAIYAYEVDGFGSFYAMDDANIPSLLSLPYLEWVSERDVVYQRTRQYLLSEWNPYYFEGSAAKGIGSPHTGIGWIWPMSIIMQATTSTDDREIIECLESLQKTDAGTGFMHESFWKDDPSRFTRSWFAWANSQFGHLILKLARERPYLIFRNETWTT